MLLRTFYEWPSTAVFRTHPSAIIGTVKCQFSNWVVMSIYILEWVKPIYNLPISHVSKTLCLETKWVNADFLLLQSPVYHFSHSKDCYILLMLYFTPVIMATYRNGLAILFYPCAFFFLLFFLAYSQPSQIGCLPYFHTWCGPSANLECRSEMCCTRLDEDTQHKKSPKIHYLHTIA